MDFPSGNFVRRMRYGEMVLALSALAAAASCVSIPFQRKPVDHILATGWTAQGTAIALAQEVLLTKTAYPVSPEGPGVFETYRLGSLIILGANDRIPILIPGIHSAVRVEAAASLPKGQGFLLLADVAAETNTSYSDWRCYRIAEDGSVLKCPHPEGYRLEAFNYYLAPNSTEIRYRRPVADGSAFEILDTSTGQVTTLSDEFLTLPLRFPNDLHAPVTPCETDLASLSPREDVWAVACRLPHDRNAKDGIWLFRRNTEPQLLYTLSDPDLAIPRGLIPHEERDLEEMVTWPREEYSLTWSPDQHLLYWCGGRGAAGVLLPLEEGSPIRRSPCLKLASWSPDGTRIAGVERRRFTVWQVPNTRPAF